MRMVKIKKRICAVGLGNAVYLDKSAMQEGNLKVGDLICGDFYKFDQSLIDSIKDLGLNNEEVVVYTTVKNNPKVQGKFLSVDDEEILLYNKSKDCTFSFPIQSLVNIEVPSWS